MGKEIKKYKEFDAKGEHDVVEYPNGIKTRILISPSEEYQEKIKKRNENYKKAKEEKNKIREKEKLIKNKMRELAIKELEKEGKI